MGTEAIAIIMVFGTVALAVVIITRALFDHLRRTKAERAQAEIFNKLMDKLGSGAEVLAYLQSEAGQRLMQGAPQEKPATFGRILNSVQYGVVCTVIGIGVLFLQNIVDKYSQRDVAVVGTLILTLGIGLLAAAGASYLLSKTLGLINGKTNEQS
ncbi:hypothetical protein [Paludibaculum fermentans]|uniref:Uncharacterized protein n=1 Tax=Paludibaculum fermentans TaxID=1473598 RepID=A0A7S7SGY8_PALFE|nr:hypothetical protein [Paludibaculum fermentans]QOY85327.1 hypothetical protein IRI77_21090 [Paludibaculum fermentans]